MSEEGWLDATGEWIEPSEMGAAEEVLARLRGYHDGGLRAFLRSAARWEQGLVPAVLSDTDERLAKELLALPADPAAIQGALQHIGADRARTVLRDVVLAWNVPKEMQFLLPLYLSRRDGEVTWLLEEVGVGVTAVEVRISISSPLSTKVRHQAFYPSSALHPKEPFGMEPWWDIFTTSPLRLTDDAGTRYRQKRAEGGGGFPARVITNEHEQTWMAQQYFFTFAPGLPLEARSLTLAGTVDLTIEQPVTELPPWPTEKVCLGDFSYTIDAEGWWPTVIRDDEDLT